MKIEVKIKHEPIEDCCEPGCGSYPVAYLSHCNNCGAYMCKKHECACVVEWESEDSV
jgi:predicted nucleic acid binding AN1-type Zn finger protein